MEWRGDERNIRRDNREVAHFDHDFSAIVPTAEAHFAFGHFQSRVVGARSETELRAHDDGFGLGGCERERVRSGLLLERDLHFPVFQFQATPVLCRLIDGDAVCAEVEASPISEQHCDGAARPDRLQRFAAFP